MIGLAGLELTSATGKKFQWMPMARILRRDAAEGLGVLEFSGCAEGHGVGENGGAAEAHGESALKIGGED